jgi:hypothetical protein
LNESWSIEVSSVTEQEVQEQVIMYSNEVREVTRTRQHTTTVRLVAVSPVSEPASSGFEDFVSLTPRCELSAPPGKTAAAARFRTSGESSKAR